METIKHRDVYDKSNWVRGEWDDEPDKVQWPDEQTGYPCLIVRQSSGHLCGYVGVAKGHPCFERDYDSVYDLLPELEVHGGLTYAAECQTERKECESVCHKIEKDQDDNFWWLGFDCAHSGDYSSMSYPEDMRMRYPHYDAVYRNVIYVKRECKVLAKQLHGLEE